MSGCTRGDPTHCGCNVLPGGGHQPADAQASAGQQMRVQVLDVGDVVETQNDGKGTVVVVWRESDLYSVCWDSMGMATHGWERHELSRQGGDLQVGDFVRVSGGVCAYGSKTPFYAEWPAALIQGNFRDAFYIAPLHRTVLFEAHRVVLTRISKAEALA